MTAAGCLQRGGKGEDAGILLALMASPIDPQIHARNRNEEALRLAVAKAAAQGRRCTPATWHPPACMRLGLHGRDEFADHVPAFGEFAHRAGGVLLDSLLPTVCVRPRGRGFKAVGW